MHKETDKQIDLKKNRTINAKYLLKFLTLQDGLWLTYIYTYSVKIKTSLWVLLNTIAMYVRIIYTIVNITTASMF